MARSGSWMIKSKDSWSDQGGCQYTTQQSWIKILHQIRNIKKKFSLINLFQRKKIDQERETILERENSRQKNFQREKIYLGLLRQYDSTNLIDQIK